MSNNRFNNISKNKKDNLIDQMFFKKYRVIEKIGEGAFGSIYKGEYNNKFYALKFEDIKNEKHLLENEASIMIHLKGPNIPYIKTYGTCGEFNILVMQLLGKDLITLLEERGSFSIKTVCLLAYQMISILEYIHNKNVIHRDIKPDNFLMGLDENSKYVYLLDFGLSKTFNKYSNSEDKHKNENKRMTGTPRYASINALKGLEQSQKDDLESLGYVLIYLANGSLPWQGIKFKNKAEKIKTILVQKIETSSLDLCAGLPNEFESYFDYCKNLESAKIPDYQMLKNLFVEILRKENLKFDYNYDWSSSSGDVLILKQKKIYNNEGCDKKIINYEKPKKNRMILTTEDKPIIVEKNDNLGKEDEKENEKKEEKKDNGKNEEKKENQKNEEKEIKTLEQPVCCCIIY